MKNADFSERLVEAMKIRMEFPPSSLLICSGRLPA